MAILRDRVTDLETQNALMRALLNALPDFVYAKDSEHRFTFSNLALARQMGLDRAEDMIGKSDFDFYPEAMSRQFLEDEQQFLVSGEDVIDLEQPTLDIKTGRKGWALGSKILARDQAGNVAGIMGIGRDVTALKTA